MRPQQIPERVYRQVIPCGIALNTAQDPILIMPGAPAGLRHLMIKRRSVWKVNRCLWINSFPEPGQLDRLATMLTVGPALLDQPQ